jgi:hypothetical protein
MKKMMSKDQGRALQRHEERQALMRDSFYAQVDPRRAYERRDFEIVQEDHKAIANCSPDGFVREVRQSRYNEQSPMLREFGRIVLEAGE